MDRLIDKYIDILRVVFHKKKHYNTTLPKRLAWVYNKSTRSGGRPWAPSAESSPYPFNSMDPGTCSKMLVSAHQLN